MKRRLLHLVVALMAFASTTMAQSLSVAPIETMPGTETTITVNIAGATEMTALQCNLQLPEGLTLAGDIALGDAAKGHTLSTSTLASGDLLIVLYDLYQSTFTDGTLLTIPVVAAEEPSTTEGTLHKVRTSTIAAQSKALSDVKFTAVVGEEEPEAKYYWYVGTTMPDAVDPSTWEVSSTDAGFTATVNIADGDNYLVIPNDWVYTAIEPSTNLPFEWNSWVKPADKVKIPGYTIKKAGNMVASEVEVTFSKAEGYYWYSGSMMQYGVDVNSWRCSTTDAEFTADMTIYEGNNYLIIPDSWDYTMVESSTGLPFDWKPFIIEEDKTTISGYVIVKVSDMTSGYVRITFTKKEENPTPETTYYWYLGTEKLLTDEEVEAKGIQISDKSEITTLTWESAEYVYFIYPKEFGKAVIIDEGGDEAGGKAVEALSNVNLEKYTGWRFNKDSQGAEFSISFTEPEYTVSLDQTNVTLAVGESVALTATVTPEGATTESMWWQIYDTNIATVENGVVTAVSEGSTRVIVHVGDYFAACQVTVEAAAVEPEPTPITSIEELNNVTLYYISLPNHKNGLVSWAAAENGLKMKSCADLGVAPDANDTKQQFAFISNDDGATRYLYHAVEKKFVAKDGSLCEYPHDALSFVAGAYEGTFVAHFDDSHYINVGGSSQMAVDSWTTADGGNSAVILPVGEYDPAEALAAFGKELPTVTGITSIDELSNEKLYYVSLPSHTNGLVSWAVNGEALKSSKDLGIISCPGNSFQQFAFINYGGAYYLYHAASKMFVGADGTLSDTPASTISFSAGNADGTFVVYFDNDHYINVGGSNQMIIDGWNTPDGGNSCVIAPVADFDPAEAIEAIKTTGIESSVLEAQGSQLIYDLQGRRVTHPTKGIYIVGGRKVVIK